MISEQLYTQYGQTYILTDDGVMHIEAIRAIDLTNIENGSALVTGIHGHKVTVTGIAALELIWMLKPSALEGKRLTWQKNSWIVHNLIAHPFMQILSWIGLYKWAMWIHDTTVPKPKGFKC